MAIEVFDFFSGCGGTSSGFRSAGMKIRLGLDFDQDSINTFKLNFPEAEVLNKDIASVSTKDINTIVGNRKNPILFSGCAPCQPFSKQNRQKKSDDKRASLLAEFGRFIDAYHPDYIFVENVPGMQKNASKSKVFSSFINLINGIGYKFDVQVVNAIDFGVPQKRSRLILIASLHDKISITRPKILPLSTTVRHWIHDLPKVNHGETHPLDPDHHASKLSEINLSRIRHTPEGGGRDSWPEHLILNCHKGYKGHTDVYGRLKWDAPASGLTTRCNSYSNGRFGHPEQDRAITIREAACLQTFPRNFKFYGSAVSRAKQVGNAVPPLMAESIAELFQINENYRLR